HLEGLAVLPRNWGSGGGEARGKLARRGCYRPIPLRTERIVPPPSPGQRNMARDAHRGAGGTADCGGCGIRGEERVEGGLKGAYRRGARPMHQAVAAYRVIDPHQGIGCATDPLDTQLAGRVVDMRDDPRPCVEELKRDKDEAGNI